MFLDPRLANTDDSHMEFIKYSVPKVLASIWLCDASCCWEITVFEQYSFVEGREDDNSWRPPRCCGRAVSGA